jgi:hypothetical protein
MHLSEAITDLGGTDAFDRLSSGKQTDIINKASLPVQKKGGTVFGDRMWTEDDGTIMSFAEDNKTKVNAESFEAIAAYRKNFPCTFVAEYFVDLVHEKVHQNQYLNTPAGRDFVSRPDPVAGSATPTGVTPLVRIAQASEIEAHKASIDGWEDVRKEACGK